MIDVQLHSNGDYWQAVWTNAQGKRVRKSLGSKAKLSPRAAEKARRAMAAKIDGSPSMAAGGKAPPLDAWLKRYLELRTDLSHASKLDVQKTGGYLLEHFGADRRIDRITRADAAGFRAWLTGLQVADVGGRMVPVMGEQTVRKHMRNCRSIFGQRHGALKLDLIAFNPFDREHASPLDVDNDWRYVNDDETVKLLEACPSLNWRTLIALCRWAGLRLGEAMRLQWAHVKFDDRRIIVHHKGKRTTKKKSRVVPMDARLHDELLARFDQAGAGEGVVGLSANNLTRNFQAIVAAAGLDEWDKLFHTLRKNRETDWLSVYPVMDVCRWMGHDPAVAKKHYHQVREDVMRLAAGVDKTQIEQVAEAYTALSDAINPLFQYVARNDLNDTTRDLLTQIEYACAELEHRLGIQKARTA